MIRFALRHSRAFGAGFAVLLISGAAASTTSCAQTPPNSPVRSFDRAQKVDVVCMHVENYDPITEFVTEVYPQPLPQSECGPAPIDVDGTTLPNHLFAMVTQTTRGEVAIVDLTAGNVVDIDNSTPGINFLPVGKNPTDIGSAPDGTYTYVAAAEPGKPAIYALDSRRILGDSRAFDFDLSTIPDGGGAPQPFVIPTLTTWPACSLPQAPGAISIVPAALGPTADGGTTTDAGADAGAGDGGATNQSAQYSIAVVLPGDEVNSAKLLMLDPAQFTDGTIGPGSLTSCKILASIELSSAAPTTWTPGPTWDDGIRADGGFNETTTTQDAGVVINDAGPDGGDAGTTDLVTTTTTFPAGVGSPPLAASCVATDAGPTVNDISDVPVSTPRAGFLARDANTLYIADEALPLIHVIDVSNPSGPRELSPLLATSQLNPSRRVAVGQIAVSPSTRDYRRYLYAIDQKEGSIMVFDVSDPATSSHVPLTRPHPEINPFLAPDRIAFSVPVASLTFATHDFSPSVDGNALQRGLLCNPNKAAWEAQATPIDPGAYFRANTNVADLEGSLGLSPGRLRGVFGFATLTNGSVVIIDVDDWDAPCRRPDPMGNDPNDLDFPTASGAAPFPLTSSITPNEPPHTSPTGDLDPYHAPIAYGSFVSLAGLSSATSAEAFFPVSAPNRLRSYNLLRNDPTTGLHVPNVVSPPILNTIIGGNATPLPISGAPGFANPILVPTYSELADTSYEATPTNPDPTLRTPTFPNGAKSSSDKLLSQPIMNALPNVRIAWEDPTAHYDQDWHVTYEGVLPSYSGTPGQSGIQSQLSTNDGFNSIVMSLPNGQCQNGVEDAQLGAEHANESLAEMPKYGITPPSRLDHRVGDYVQLSEDVLGPDDPYWGEDDSASTGGTCWDWDPAHPHTTAQDRHDTCQAYYGYAGDQSIQRDFPIWQAYDDHFVIGRYGYTDATNNPTSREIVGPDPSNAETLKAMYCCFHRSVQFHVRSGGEWVATGSVSGLLHRVTRAANNACVQSCDPREALLNSRSVGLPRANFDLGRTPPDRNSILAMRNPMFSYLIWDGADPTNTVDFVPVRDMQWLFSMRGQFVPLSIDYAGSTQAAVSPQSMIYLPSFGRVAVVDGVVGRPHFARLEQPHRQRRPVLLSGFVAVAAGADVRMKPI